MSARETGVENVRCPENFGGIMKAIKWVGLLLIFAGVGAAVIPNINVVAGIALALIGYGLYSWGRRKEKANQ